MTSCGASVDGMLKRVYPCRQDRNILNRRMRSLRICAGKKCRKTRNHSIATKQSTARSRARQQAWRTIRQRPHVEILMRRV